MKHIIAISQVDNMTMRIFMVSSVRQVSFVNVRGGNERILPIPVRKTVAQTNSSDCYGLASGEYVSLLAMAGNIVAEWLRSLHLGQYADSFIDNGYDDLEICKQVGDPDLDAIGVFNPVHRNRLLQSVRTLREEGAASVYFSLEESAAVHEECLCDNLSARSSRTSSGRSDKEAAAAAAAAVVSSVNRIQTSPGASSSADSGQEAAKYLDEYEEGKAELVKIPRMQLKMLLREKLAQDGIRLTCQPYSTPVSLVTCYAWLGKIRSQSLGTK